MQITFTTDELKNRNNKTMVRSFIGHNLLVTIETLIRTGSTYGNAIKLISITRDSTDNTKFVIVISFAEGRSVTLTVQNQDTQSVWISERFAAGWTVTDNQAARTMLLELSKACDL